MQEKATGQRMLRARNIMKHVCVAARIGEDKAPGAGNSYSYCQDEQRSHRRFWLQPFGLARVFACSSRLSANGFFFWGGDGSRAAHRDNGTHVTVPANGPAANESRRRVVETALLRMTKPRAFRLALSENRDSASRVSLC